MAPDRLEPFRQALVDLRRRLRDGALEPGARITAKEVADQLKLSHTPVREALSRLAGEGLLEDRRGDGFFVPELTVADIAVLYRLSEQLLLICQEAGRGPTPPTRPPRTGAEELDPVRAVERLFLAWAAESGSRIVLDAYRTTMLQLAPARRREVQLIDDLAQEAQTLQRLAEPAERHRRPAAIQQFHRRRVALAEPLARLLQPPPAESE